MKNSYFLKENKLREKTALLFLVNLFNGWFNRRQTLLHSDTYLCIQSVAVSFVTWLPEGRVSKPQAQRKLWFIDSASRWRHCTKPQLLIFGAWKLDFFRISPLVSGVLYRDSRGVAEFQGTELCVAWVGG